MISVCFVYNNPLFKFDNIPSIPLKQQIKIAEAKAEMSNNEEIYCNKEKSYQQIITTMRAAKHDPSVVMGLVHSANLVAQQKNTAYMDLQKSKASYERLCAQYKKIPATNTKNGTRLTHS